MRGFHNKKGKQMSYEINVLVNGNRCKQYFHNGRTFIEAKKDSEYVIEIKNNTWERILAVVSVDGLNVIDGKTADENGPGYVMNSYTSQKLYGFQYSPDNVATFKFGTVGAVKIDPKTGKPEIDPKTGKTIPLGYAASKEDGSEKNVGVIGVRIWDEVPQPPPPPTITWTFSSLTSSFTTPFDDPPYPITGYWTSTNPADWNTGYLHGLGHYKYRVSNESTTNATHTTALISAKSTENFVDNSSQVMCSTETPNVVSFDMETQWGQSRPYKVKETTFKRREVIHKVDIYYASRESLIAMGINLGIEKQVSFPESFRENKYAKPPKGWKP